MIVYITLSYHPIASLNGVDIGTNSYLFRLGHTLVGTGRGRKAVQAARYDRRCWLSFTCCLESPLLCGIAAAPQSRRSHSLYSSAQMCIALIAQLILHTAGGQCANSGVNAIIDPIAKQDAHHSFAAEHQANPYVEAAMLSVSYLIAFMFVACRIAVRLQALWVIFFLEHCLQALSPNTFQLSLAEGAIVNVVSRTPVCPHVE